MTMKSSPPLRCAAAALAVFVALTISSCADEEPAATAAVAPKQDQKQAAPKGAESVEQATYVIDENSDVEPAPDPGDSAAATIDPAATDDEVERTYALNDELNHMVESLATQLSENQSDAFRQEQASWRSNGFRCPNGRGYHTCVQYHIKNRIRELRYRVEPVSSTAIAPN